MFKVSLVAVVFFVLGLFSANYYNQIKSPVASNIEEANTPFSSNSELAETGTKLPVPDSFGPEKISKKTTKADPNLFKTAKTQFEFFEILASLKSASADELKEYVLLLGKEQADARSQVAWLLAGKYPDEALDFLTTLMNRSDLDLAKLMLQCVGQNHAKLAWDWIKGNESELDKMFLGNVGSKYEYKLFVLNWLARSPEQKWIAYEEVQALTANGPRKGDKYNVLSVAINAASSDPDEAINRALSGVDGGRDSMLFNGAVGVIIGKDVARAKDLVLQNQDLADDSSASKVAYNLMQNNQFSEAYSFVNSLTKPELRNSAIGAVSERAIVNGVERSKAFANAISSDEVRHVAVRSMVNSMDVSGQPIKDQMALLDSTLQKIPADKKAFDYAYAMRDWPKKNASEFNTYMNDFRFRDKPFADEVEKMFQYVQKK